MATLPTPPLATPAIHERIAALCSLLRPLNATIAFAGACAGALMAGALIAGAGIRDLPLLAVCGGAAFLLTAGGNVLNDVFDVDADRVNRPDRALARGAVTRATAILLYALCTAAGLALSAALSPRLLLLAAVSAALAAAYNAALKRVPLAGNIVVGALSGAIFLYGALAAGAPAAGVIPALFACVYTVAREILKDMEDMAGDRAAGIRTFPLVAGPRAAALTVTAILALLFVCSPLPYFTGTYSAAYIVVLACTVETVLMYAIVRLLRFRDNRTLSALSRMLKLDMIAGMLAFLAGSLLP